MIEYSNIIYPLLDGIYDKHIAFFINPFALNENITKLGVGSWGDEFEILDTNRLTERDIVMENNGVCMFGKLIYDKSVFEKKSMFGISNEYGASTYIYGKCICIIQRFTEENFDDFENYLQKSFIFFNDTEHNFLFSDFTNNNGKKICFIQGYDNG
ncbi:hypothetical protein [Sulfurimonas autotrophica]|uniref:Uncharacterized protein n=1 Tax=Sulfurimonas autotrophica (strain ATCC BAA-671 / DSM 16294 / JCM 11897 / OK10) TaxID=563040 RepID=E0URF7_SULAO|nr:hypothetical protein [Sulfurimonas autotrophica]ADN10043.1 hypothetical protein Saut_2000 [Sulfurimonas autotrophica DSM 16294]